MNKVFKTDHYPVWDSSIHSGLSIFTGSMIKCSNDIIDSRFARMEIDTYSAIMTTKFNVNSITK